MSEFTVWQAARATAAAPMYFKPFKHSGTAYVDGAIKHNCPVIVADSERRRIWGDVSDWPADFLLSLGTGVSGVQSDAPTHSGIWYGLRLAFKMIDDQLNCNKIWREYFNEASIRGGHRFEARRNMRINVPFQKERPPLDGVEHMEALEKVSLCAVQNDPQLRADIHEAAHRLVASCFYFDVSSTSPSQETAGYSFKGTRV